MKIAFFGASQYVLPILETLNKNFELALVVTTESEPGDAVPSYCKQNSIPYLSVEKITNEVIEKIRKVDAPIAALAYFGLIVPAKALELFPHGIINIHPSLLPKYRGPTPVQTALLHGEAITGVTIIKLDAEVDHGPILAQTTEPINSDDTTHTLHERLFPKGAGLLQDVFKKIENQEPVNEKQQDHSQATFTEHLTRQSGFFDIQNPPDRKQFDRMIRAYHPWPGVWTKLQMANGVWRIVKFLPEQKLQVEGKKPVSYKDFLNGYPEMREKIGKFLMTNS